MCTLMGLCNNEGCKKMPLVKVVPGLEAKKRVPMMKLQPAAHVKDNLSVYPLVRLVPAKVLNKKEMIETNEIFRKAYA